MVQTMTFLVWVYISKDFVQTQLNSAQLHDVETVTFRNSAPHPTQPQIFLYAQNVRNCEGSHGRSCNQRG